MTSSVQSYFSQVSVLRLLCNKVALKHMKFRAFKLNSHYNFKELLKYRISSQSF